jgi:hypothetical protein
MWSLGVVAAHDPAAASVSAVGPLNLCTVSYENTCTSRDLGRRRHLVRAAPAGHKEACHEQSTARDVAFGMVATADPRQREPPRRQSRSAGTATASLLGTHGLGPAVPSCTALRDTLSSAPACAAVMVGCRVVSPVIWVEVSTWRSAKPSVSGR